jgi:hypothetical protein
MIPRDQWPCHPGTMTHPCAHRFGLAGENVGPDAFPVGPTNRILAKRKTYQA